MTNRLRMGTALKRLLSGQLKMADGRLERTAAHEMHRELGRPLARAGAVTGLQPHAAKPVQPGAPTGRYAVVQHLLIEIVDEAVARGDRAIRPFGGAARVQEPALTR